MPTLFAPSTRASLIARFDALAPTDRPRWGKMTPAQMICHLIDGIRIPLGQNPPVDGEPTRRPFGPILRTLAVYVLPWPKGKIPTTAQYRRTKPGAWGDDLRQLHSAVEQFAICGPDARFTPHPALGDLSGKAWGVLIARHCDYHLRQFGR